MDWFQPQVQAYLNRLPNLKPGVIAGVFETRGATLWAHRQMAAVHDTWAVGTTPIPLWRNEAWRCRYSFGYSLDDSNKPVFLIWPSRTEHNGLWLLDVETGHYHDLCQTPSNQNLELEHFYAAFGLRLLCKFVEE